MVVNPFVIGVVARGSSFTDRAAETAAVSAAIREAGARLLVSGERRMGKTSVLRRAVEAAGRRGVGAALVDCGTAGTPIEVANRVLTEAARVLGRDWAQTVRELAGALSMKLQLGLDAQTQLPTVTVEAGLGATSRTAQPHVLEEVLRALDERARKQKTPFGVVLDEVQRLLGAMGGDVTREEDAIVAGEWRLRGILQDLPNLSVVLAGSEPTLFAAMQTHGRAFYNQFTPLHIGPIAPEHFARWIDDRAESAGVRFPGLGQHCLALAGPRTRDVVQLARESFTRGATPLRGRVKKQHHPDTEHAVTEAYRDVVESQADPFRSLWDSLALGQQQALRAVSAAQSGMTTAATRTNFGLGASGPVAKSVAALAAQRLIIRDASVPAGWVFDNPFFRGWVVYHCLPDIGLFLPITYRAGM